MDYRSKVTRADFEIACKDLKGEFTRPIFDALANAGLTLVCNLVIEVWDIVADTQ